MRTNPVEIVFNCLASLEGCGSRHDEYLFNERQAHRETPIMMLLGEFTPDFALLDAFDSAADGLVGCIASIAAHTTAHLRRRRHPCGR